jgi:hypothetical protein
LLSGVIAMASVAQPDAIGLIGSPILMGGPGVLVATRIGVIVPEPALLT